MTTFVTTQPIDKGAGPGLSQLLTRSLTSFGNLDSEARQALA